MKKALEKSRAWKSLRELLQVSNKFRCPPETVAERGRMNGVSHIFSIVLCRNRVHFRVVPKVNNANANGKTPSGQPLPGIIATLVVGGGAIVYLKKRKKLLASK